VGRHRNAAASGRSAALHELRRHADRLRSAGVVAPAGAADASDRRSPSALSPNDSYLIDRFLLDRYRCGRNPRRYDRPTMTGSTTGVPMTTDSMTTGLMTTDSMTTGLTRIDRRSRRHPEIPTGDPRKTCAHSWSGEPTRT
jgi:hypothetical protein